MRKTIAIILCFMILMTSMPLTVFGAEKISAKLIQMEGDVQVIRAGGEKPFKAFVNMRLTEGDRIITGTSGKAKIEMDDEVVITLAENTRIYLSELRGSKGAKQSSINLQSGGVGSSVKEKLKDNSRFEIKTPTAVMGVRGTEFFTQYYNGNVDVRVVDGVVEVTVNVTSEGDVTGVGGAGARTYSFPIAALQQVAFSEGDDAGDLPEGIEALDLEGMPLPFLDRIREINEEDPDAIPKDILDTIDKAIEDAIRALKEKLADKDLIPDEIASSLEKSIVGNIQQSTPTVNDPPPQEPRESSRGDRDDRDDGDDEDDEITMCELTLCGGGGILYSEYEGKDATYTISGYYMPYASECNVEYIPKGTEVKINIIPPSDGYTRVALLVDEKEIKKGEDIGEKSPIDTHEEYFYTFQILKDTKIEGLFDKYRVIFDEEEITALAYDYETEENETIFSGNFIGYYSEILFIAEKDGYAVDKWKINGAEITENDDCYIEGDSLFVYKLIDDIHVEVEFEDKLATCSVILMGEGLEIISPDLEEYEVEPGFYEGIEAGAEVTVKIEGEWEERLALLINDELKVYDEDDYDWRCIEDTHVYYTYTFTIEEDTEIEVMYNAYQVFFDSVGEYGDKGNITAALYSAWGDEYKYPIESGDFVDLDGEDCIVFIATPDDEYVVDAWKVNNIVFSYDENTLTFYKYLIDDCDDVNVTIEFQPKPEFDIYYDDSENPKELTFDNKSSINLTFNLESYIDGSNYDVEVLEGEQERLKHELIKEEEWQLNIDVSGYGRWVINIIGYNDDIFIGSRKIIIKSRVS
jgi:hypothetical protein